MTGEHMNGYLSPMKEGFSASGMSMKRSVFAFDVVKFRLEVEGSLVYLLTYRHGKTVLGRNEKRWTTD